MSLTRAKAIASWCAVSLLLSVVNTHSAAQGPVYGDEQRLERALVVGFSAGMYRLEDTDVVVVVLTNIGAMHSGLMTSPTGVFMSQLWFPAVMRNLGR